MNEKPVSKKIATRRDVLRILAVGGAVGAAWKLGVFRGKRGVPVTRTATLMGTTVNLTVLGEDAEAAAAAADATLARMSGLEALLTRYRDDSEVGRLNTVGRVDDASDALLDVLRLADRMTRLGDGAFDVTVQPVLDAYRRTLTDGQTLPSEAWVEEALSKVGQHRLRVDGRTVTVEPGVRVTLDGIGKGYVVDKGVAELKAAGFPNVFVEAGGDLVAAGEKAGGVPWRVGIRSPRPGMSLVARFDARESAVATSGDYMQPFTPDFAQHHILDPRTGRSAPELACSTVIAPTAATADGLATLTMVLGSAKGQALLEDLPGCEGYFVTKDLEVVRTSGFTTV